QDPYRAAAVGSRALARRARQRALPCGNARRTLAGAKGGLMANRTVLISGATGQQGGAVARQLVNRGFTVRGMTRKPDGKPAQALRELGVEIVKGDLDDAASIEKALAGVWGVFAVQNTWEAGVEREEAQGKRFAKLARDNGVQHLVYTSVGSAHRKT